MNELLELPLLLYLFLFLALPLAAQLGPAEDFLSKLPQDGSLLDLVAIGLENILF